MINIGWKTGNSASVDAQYSSNLRIKLSYDNNLRSLHVYAYLFESHANDDSLSEYMNEKYSNYGTSASYDEESEEIRVTLSDIDYILEPYREYGLMSMKLRSYANSTSKIRTRLSLLDMTKYGSSIKMNIKSLIDMISEVEHLRIITGDLSSTDKITFIVFGISKDNFTFDTTEEINEFEVEASTSTKIGCNDLWDSYSITIGDNELFADCDGNLINSTLSTIKTTDSYIPVHIKKYSGMFQSDRELTQLTRAMDNETVFIDCSIGIVDTKRVRLVNGEGDFKIYPFNYNGYFKLKLGRKYYNPWNEYDLKIGE